jgi:hypothetical protein
MFTLSFGAILVSLVFNTIIALVYALLRFPKCSSFLLKDDNVFQMTLSKFRCVVISYIACALLLV